MIKTIFSKIKMYKRPMIFMLIMILLTISLFIGILIKKSKVENKSIDIHQVIDSKTTAYKTDLLDSLDSFTSDQAIRTYLENWAKAKSLSINVDNANNLSIYVQGNELYKDAKPTIIICPYSYKSIEYTIPQMTTALFLAKNNQNTGDLTVIFTPSDDSYNALSKLKPSVIPTNANVFVLNSSLRQGWSFHSSNESLYEFKAPITYTKPTQGVAFNIKISNAGGFVDSRINSHPNAIKELTNLLAYFKTNAMLFQLSDINGGNSYNLYPNSASMTIVVQDNYADKFKSKIEKTKNNFISDYKDDFPNANFEIETVPMPEKVLSSDSQNAFISAMYTIPCSVYTKNPDNEALSLINIGELKLTDNEFIVKASGIALTDEAIQNIDDDLKLTCGVFGMSYNKISSIPKFNGDDKSEMAKKISEAFKIYTGYTMEYIPILQPSAATVIQKLNNTANIVTIAYKDSKIERYSGVILTFMLAEPHLEKELFKKPVTH